MPMNKLPKPKPKPAIIKQKVPEHPPAKVKTTSVPSKQKSYKPRPQIKQQVETIPEPAQEEIVEETPVVEMISEPVVIPEPVIEEPIIETKPVVEPEVTQPSAGFVFRPIYRGEGAKKPIRKEMATNTTPLPKTQPQVQPPLAKTQVENRPVAKPAAKPVEKPVEKPVNSAKGIGKKNISAEPKKKPRPDPVKASQNVVIDSDTVGYFVDTLSDALSDKFISKDQLEVELNNYFQKIIASQQ